MPDSCYTGELTYFVVHMEVLEETFLLGGGHLYHMPRDKEREDEEKREPHYGERRGIPATGRGRGSLSMIDSPPDLHDHMTYWSANRATGLESFPLSSKVSPTCS